MAGVLERGDVIVFFLGKACATREGVVADNAVGESAGEIVKEDIYGGDFGGASSEEDGGGGVEGEGGVEGGGIGGEEEGVEDCVEDEEDEERS